MDVMRCKISRAVGYTPITANLFVGVLRSHKDAPRVLLANSNLVGKWATWEHFRELEKKGLIMYGQMTAGSWIYIGSQGIVQGTYETYLSLAAQHYNGEH